MNPPARPIRIVIQSRLSSSRLPGKSLLQVGGMPAVLLCARRAGRGGLAVRVAVPDDSAEDVLARRLAAAGVDAVRGPLDDVLARFCIAAQDLPDDGIVVRLTADNLFPDGEFIAGLLRRFQDSPLDYLGTQSPQDGLPYGLSAEVFTAGALRRAARETDLAGDREHVTPWIRRHLRAARLESPDAPPHWARLRCTIDTFDDFVAVADAFDRVADPVTAGWRELVGHLAAATPGRDRPRCPWRVAGDGTIHSAITLGSAQFGMNYGIANRGGRPDDASLRLLLREAADAGLTCIDTARAYGDAEDRLGRWLGAGGRSRMNVVTKLDVLSGLRETAGRDEVHAAVDASVYRSLHALDLRRLDTLLLHRWQHHDAWQGQVWQRLLQLRDAGVVGRLGASISTPEQAIAALQDPDVTHLQCPVNLLDHRWRNAHFLEQRARRPEVVVHARSVLLQGLLTLPAPAWPVIDGVDAHQLCEQLDALVQAHGRSSRADLCLAYVRALPWVTSLVIGMETPAQLRANLDLAAAQPLTAAALQDIEARFAALPVTLLDPAQWPRALH